MLTAPPLAAAARRAATAAACGAAHRLLLPVCFLSSNPSAPSTLVPRRRFGHMSQECMAPRAPLPPVGRNFAVAVGDEILYGEAPELVVVSFYRFADFPDHAAFRLPLKELCEELVSAQKSHLRQDIVACDVFDLWIAVSAYLLISEAELLEKNMFNIAKGRAGKIL